jgi:hypothetical protein
LGDPNAPPLDQAQLLRTLNRHRFEYILVGGAASNAHGATRVTTDVDIVVRWSTDNLDRVARALTELTACHLLPATRRTLAVLDPGRHRPSRATNRFRRFKQNPRVLHLARAPPEPTNPPKPPARRTPAVVAQLMAIRTDPGLTQDLRDRGHDWQLLVTIGKAHR